MIRELPLPAQSEILTCSPSSSTSHVRWPCTPWWCRPTVGEWWARSPAGGQFLHGAAPSVWRHFRDDRGSCCMQTDGIRRSHCSAAQLLVSFMCCAVRILTSYPQPCTVLTYRSHKWVVRCTQIMNLNFEFEFEFITVLTQEFSRHNFFTTVCCIIVISLKY